MATEHNLAVAVEVYTVASEPRLKAVVTQRANREKRAAKRRKDVTGPQVFWEPRKTQATRVRGRGGGPVGEGHRDRDLCQLEVLKKVLVVQGDEVP